MEVESQRPRAREDTISALNEAIEGLKTSSFAPAKTVLGSVTALLTFIRVCLTLLQRSAPGSHTASRTRRRMNWIMSNLGCFALTSPERSTKRQMERNRTSSVSPCMMR